MEVIEDLLLHQSDSGPGPGGGVEEEQDGEELQTADEHEGGQEPLAQVRETAEVGDGTDPIQTGAYVAQAAKAGGEGGDQGVTVQGDHQASGTQQKEEENKKGKNDRHRLQPSPYPRPYSYPQRC